MDKLEGVRGRRNEKREHAGARAGEEGRMGDDERGGARRTAKLQVVGRGVGAVGVGR